MRRPFKNIGAVFDIGDTIVKVQKLRYRAASCLLKPMARQDKRVVLSRLFDEFDQAAKHVRYNNLLFGLPAQILEESFRHHVAAGKVSSLVFSSRYREQVRRLLKPNRRVINTLDALRTQGLKIAVLSNGTNEEMIDAIRLIGIARFCDEIGISEAIGAVKPEPKAFDWIVKSLDLSPERLVMIGDDLDADIFGAVSAGWKAIWLNGDKKIVPSNVICVKSTDLTNLPIVLRNLF